jgi:hypothetical protein
MLERLINRDSILKDAIDSTTDLGQVSESEELRISIARKLRGLKTESSQTRAAFIYEQKEENFTANRETWGIPEFREDLVDSSDFENGFLWRFRAHSTSWSENQYADKWFYTSLEARTITRYEFWSCDEGPDTIDFYFEGDYKSILKRLLFDHLHEVLISPVFSTEELNAFIASFSEEDEDYTLEEVIEDYISQNPNYRP